MDFWRSRLLLLSGALLSGALSVAFAADLPKGKAGPGADDLVACRNGDAQGLRIPGSDLCVKMSGYVSALFQEGSLANQRGLYFLGPSGASAVTTTPPPSLAQRDGYGYTTHGQINFDVRSNTEFGPLRSYVELNAVDMTGAGGPYQQTYLNNGFVEIAGFTAGRAPSNFAYLANGATWYDFYSPDRVSGNQPLLLAYSAKFGSGFSATVSLEDPTGTQVDNFIDFRFYNHQLGIRAPDLVATLRVDQAWGSAQISGALHQTRVAGFYGDLVDHWGGAALIGASFNLPSLGRGDKVALQLVRSQAALGYSGIPNTEQSAGDQGLNLNGNGTIFQLTDALNYAPGAWSYPSTWTAAAQFEHHPSERLLLEPEISAAKVDYSGSPAIISSHAASVLGGMVVRWTPVWYLDFQFQFMAEKTWQATPAGYVGPAPFQKTSSGVLGAVEIVRGF